MTFEPELKTEWSTRVHMYTHTHTQVYITCARYIYTRDTTEFEVIRKREASRMAVNVVARVFRGIMVEVMESVGRGASIAKLGRAEGKSFETGRRKVHFGVSS